MANKTISELSTATLSDNLVMVVEGATATEKTTVASLKEYIQEGVSIDVDSALSATSENPVQNKVITTALNNKVDSSSLASVATSGAYSDLTGTPTIPESVIVDQTYDPESTNAQSGVAIAGAGFLTSHQDISSKQDVSNLVTSLSASSTDTQYPSAKCVYDMIGDIEAVLATI